MNITRITEILNTIPPHLRYKLALLWADGCGDALVEFVDNWGLGDL
jgi:hypothetical protein